MAAVNQVTPAAQTSRTLTSGVNNVVVHVQTKEYSKCGLCNCICKYTFGLRERYRKRKADRRTRRNLEFRKEVNAIKDSMIELQRKVKELEENRDPSPERIPTEKNLFASSKHKSKSTTNVKGGKFY